MVAAVSVSSADQAYGELVSGVWDELTAWWAALA
jgi:hypothetical protein